MDHNKYRNGYSSGIVLVFALGCMGPLVNDLSDLHKHALSLLSVRRVRTVRYRLAWYLAVFSVLCLGTLLVEKAILRALA